MTAPSRPEWFRGSRRCLARPRPEPCCLRGHEHGLDGAEDHHADLGCHQRQRQADERSKLGAERRCLAVHRGHGSRWPLRGFALWYGANFGGNMEEAEIGEVGVDKQAEAAHREKAKEERHRVPWLRGLAVSSACFAVIAAIASLKSGHSANEALLKQSRATDQWAYYQATGE